MEENIYKHKRKRNRLKDFDYSSVGTYFITICTKNRAQFLSEIRWKKRENVGDDVLGVPSDTNPFVVLTEWGEIVKKHIEEMDAYYENIDVDNYVIMPNHIHLLLTIKEPAEKSVATDGVSGAGESFTEGTPRTVDRVTKDAPRTVDRATKDAPRTVDRATKDAPRTVGDLAEGTPRTSSPTHSLISQFVSTLKRFCNKEFGMNAFQRSYHDHIIRNQEDYNRKYVYIERNPLEWLSDDYYF